MPVKGKKTWLLSESLLSDRFTLYGFFFHKRGVHLLDIHKEGLVFVKHINSIIVALSALTIDGCFEAGTKVAVNGEENDSKQTDNKKVSEIKMKFRKETHCTG